MLSFPAACVALKNYYKSNWLFLKLFVAYAALVYFVAYFTVMLEQDYNCIEE